MVRLYATVLALVPSVLTLSLPVVTLVAPCVAAQARSLLMSLRDGVCLRKPVVRLRLTERSRDLPRVTVVAAVLCRATWVPLLQRLL